MSIYFIDNFYWPSCQVCITAIILIVFDKAFMPGQVLGAKLMGVLVGTTLLGTVDVEGKHPPCTQTWNLFNIERSRKQLTKQTPYCGLKCAWIVRNGTMSHHVLNNSKSWHLGKQIVCVYLSFIFLTVKFLEFRKSDVIYLCCIFFV